MDDLKMFEYKRGDKYKVTVVLKNRETFIFQDLVTPLDINSETLLTFIEMAEKAALDASEET